MSSQYDITQQFLNGGVVPADLVGQETVSKTYVDDKVSFQDGEIAVIAGLAATAQNTANVGVSAAGAAQSTATTAVGAAGVAQHTAEVAQTTIETHKISTKAHDSLYITYSGPVSGASSVKQALDLTKQRVDNIVASGGESNIEIVDARQPATGPAFPVLGERLNNVDAQWADTTDNITKYVDDFYIADEVDQTQMLQRALSYVQSKIIDEKRVVSLRLRAGKKYVISAPLVFRYNVGCTFTGAGTIIVSEDVNPDTPLSCMIDMKQFVSENQYLTGDFTARDVRFDANNRAINIIDTIGESNYGLAKSTFDRCQFVGIKKYGYGIHGASWSFDITKCKFIGYGENPNNPGEWYGTGIYVGNASNGLNIEGNHFTRLTRAIERPDNYYGKLNICFNRFDVTRKAAIYIESGKDITIHDNYFEGVGDEAETVYVFNNQEVAGIKACIIVVGSRSFGFGLINNVSIKRNEFASCPADDLIVFDRGFGLEVKQNSIIYKLTPHNSLVKLLKFGFGYFFRNGSYGAVIENNQLIEYNSTDAIAGKVLVNKVLDHSALIISNEVNFANGANLSGVVIKDTGLVDYSNRKRKLPMSLYTRNFILDSSYTNYFTITSEIISGEVVYRFLKKTGNALNYISVDAKYLERLKGTYVRFNLETANSQVNVRTRFTVTDGVKQIVFRPVNDQVDKTKINEYSPMEFLFYVDPNATTLGFQPYTQANNDESIYIKNFSIVPASYDLSTFYDAQNEVYRTSSAAPTVTPNFIGEELLDTTNKVWYKAVGTTSSDWKALN